MNILLTKKLSTSDLDLIRSWEWNFEIVETLNISRVGVNEIPKAEAWVISSRNSFEAVKKFINKEPGVIYCIGNWVKEELIKTGAKSIIKSFENMKKLVTELAKQNFKSVVYFCGEEHRQELEEGLRGSLVKISKVITHQSQMTFPVVKNNFDVVFIFSPRSAESLLRHNAFSAKTIFASIGPTTASYLNSRGITKIFISSYPESRILLEEFHHTTKSRLAT
jgi:uroporphyrinogen-III synthase